LSHASPDRSFVDGLADILTDHGVAHWYSRTSLAGAQQWHDEIGQALARCDWFGIVLSPAAISSRWVKQELLFALRDERYENRILPILLEECDVGSLSWTLPGFQSVDFTDDHARGYRELLRTWGIGYRP